MTPVRDPGLARGFLGEAWHRFAAALHEAPPEAQRCLVVRLFGGLACVTILSGISATAVAAVMGDGPLPGDVATAALVEELVGARGASTLSIFGSSAMLVPVVATAMVLAAMAGNAGRVLVVLVGFVGSKAVTQGAWLLWDRPRPPGVADGAFLPAAPSFPSGHVVQAVVVYGLVAAWWAGATDSTGERVVAWIVAGFVTLATVLGRIRLAAHHPSDCWAAVLLGSLWLAVALWAGQGFRTRGGDHRGVRNGFGGLTAWRSRTGGGS